MYCITCTVYTYVLYNLYCITCIVYAYVLYNLHCVQCTPMYCITYLGILLRSLLLHPGLQLSAPLPNFRRLGIHLSGLFIHSFIHFFILLFIHKSTYLIIHSSFHSFIFSFIYLFIHKSTYLFIHSFIHLFFHLFFGFLAIFYLFILLHIHSFIQLFIHWFLESSWSQGTGCLKKHGKFSIDCLCKWFLI